MTKLDTRDMFFKMARKSVMPELSWGKKTTLVCSSLAALIQSTVCPALGLDQITTRAQALDLIKGTSRSHVTYLDLDAKEGKETRGMLYTIDGEKRVAVLSYRGVPYAVLEGPFPDIVELVSEFGITEGIRKFGENAWERRAVDTGGDGIFNKTLEPDEPIRRPEWTDGIQYPD